MLATLHKIIKSQSFSIFREMIISNVFVLQKRKLTSKEFVTCAPVWAQHRLNPGLLDLKSGVLFFCYIKSMWKTVVVQASNHKLSK